MRFTEDHVWVREEEDGVITVGISDYAQQQLGDVVYVQLPQPEQILSPADEAVMIESVKATGDVRVPVSGTVIAINERLADNPDLLNRDPTGAGWLFRMDMDDPEPLAELMDENAYEEYIAGL
jgi:glycine cleavage system H protein